MKKLRSYQYNDFRITNFEMETSVIYGLSKLLGHEALSLNAIIANRATGAFSKNPAKTIDRLIIHALNRIVNI
jgi:uridine phosphorylase